MNVRDLQTAEDVKAYIKEHKIAYVTAGIFDMQGQLRGDFMPVEKFISDLEGGYSITLGYVGGDFTDVNYPIAGILDETSGYGDTKARIVPESCRILPWMPEDRNLFFILEYDDGGMGDKLCSRGLYQRILEKAKGMGLRAFHSHELEYTLFNENMHSVREKSFKNLELVKPVSTYRLIAQQSVWKDFFNDLTDTLGHLDIKLDALHWEIGKAAGEAATRYAEGMKAADDAALLKVFAKSYTQQKFGYLMSFMARWSNEAHGQSGHVHMSLRDLDNNPVFHDTSKEHNMSDTMRHFIGGMEKLMPELLLMHMPNVNSFKRFAPGIFVAPVSSWGIENKSTAMRALLAGPNSQRVEFRIPGADVNPYISLSAILGSGLWGIANKIEPNAPYEGDIFAQLESVPDDMRFPETFRDAIDRFKNSEVAKELFGEEFVRVFSEFRDFQERDFRNLVTDRELERFLELT